MNTHRKIAALLCAAVLTSCDVFEEQAGQDITGPLPSARVKFFNFAPGAPGVNFYANEVKVTAITSSTGTESTNGVNYGGVGSGGYYSAIDPGSYTFRGRIAATTNKDSTIASATQTVEAGKYYSFYMSGIYNTTTLTADAFAIEDPVPATVDFTKAYVRFVHAVSNATGPMTLYATEQATSAETAVGGEVAYKAGGAYVALTEGAYNLATRYTGSATNVMTRTNVSFAAGRVYTITARGNLLTASTLLLDNTANR